MDRKSVVEHVIDSANGTAASTLKSLGVSQHPLRQRLMDRSIKIMRTRRAHDLSVVRRLIFEYAGETLWFVTKHAAPGSERAAELALWLLSASSDFQQMIAELRLHRAVHSI